MTPDEFIDTLDQYYESSHIKFEHIPAEHRLSQRPDLHVFLLLDQLVPSTHNIVASADHDVIWLQTPIEDLAKVITREQILDLARCGVMYDNGTESLRMFA
jgi:hypothetical protein